LLDVFFFVHPPDELPFRPQAFSSQRREEID